MNPHSKPKPSANVRSPRPVRNSPVNSDTELQALLNRVETNSALVEWPRDTWGFTSELKKVALRAASEIKGQPDKQTLFLAVLQVLKAHVEARYDVDVNWKKSLNEQKASAQQARIQRTRIFGAVPKKPVETPKLEPL